MNILGGSIALLAMVSLLAGCSDGQRVGAAALANNTTIDVSSPDKALKSYWATRDAYLLAGRAIEADMLPRFQKIAESLERVMGAELAASVAPRARDVESFSRDIEEVKVESETRAVIMAVIKNSTPIPPGVQPTQRDEEERRDGHRYRYLLERDQRGWRVAEVWRWATYPRHDWEKMLPYSARRAVETSTYSGV